MTFQEYLAVDALNWSRLKHMARSPLHYQHALVNQIEDTPRLALGRAVHTALLEPDRFDEDYVVFPGERRAGKIWEAFKEMHADRTILKEEERFDANEMARLVLEHPVAGPIFEAEGDAESVITWTDPGTSKLCKARIDWVSAEAGVVADLKSTVDVDPRRFGTIASRLKYHCQIVWYLDGYGHWRRERGLPELQLRPTLVAVEVEAPHDVAVYYLDTDQIHLARETIAELLARVAECEARKEWPGIAPKAQPLLLPRWEYGDDEQGDATELGLDFTGVEERAA